MSRPVQAILGKFWLRMAACALLGAALVFASHVSATPPSTPPAPPAATPATAQGPAAAPPPNASPAQPAPAPANASGQQATGAAPAATPPSDPNNVTVIIGTMPASTATVTWGRKKLGQITPGKPLVVVRPRDSGPLDVMVRAQGYLAVQTRAHTFTDNRVVVKLTPVENIHELYGYKAPIDAGVPSPEQAAALNAIGASDAGVPAQPQPFQVVPSTPQPVPVPMPAPQPAPAPTPMAP